MRTLLTGAAVLAALIMIAVSTSMNFLFMRQLANDPIDGLVLGGASASADILKACLPWFIALAAARRRYVFALVGGVVFAGFSIFSLMSSLGFAAEMRSGLVEARVAQSRQLDEKMRALAAIDAQLQRMGVLRLTAEVERDMAIAEQDRRWTSSGQCTDATVPASRAFCAEHVRLVGEREVISKAAELQARRNALVVAIAELRQAGADGADDPQAAVIAKLLSQDEGGVRTALIVAAALLVEVGSGLGLWLALGHSPRTARDVAQRAFPAQSSPMSKLVAASSLPALPPPRKEGDVVDFCADRLQPAARGGLTIVGLYRSYEIWCREVGLQPKALSVFGEEFAALAPDWGIARDGDRYVGVRIGIAL
ncbi:MAG: hypothetical protein J0I57_07490 [Hyphomicrobium sp.]|jgi:hypothetical protein|nr:hypothetical protein [Hyphomicrobium sp.]MBN9265862.1 hypothetical protein [Hyphomicrobium sp.]MBN9277463.1 hypothetical protein [Hyphomicrobium sp.]OJU28802.1 MAG: hypothetical protein BGN89_07785 [Alphaproteobacteria bacterium 64-6]